MKAARLHEYQKPLQIDDVPVPKVKKGGVLIRIAGAGVCHSDLHLMNGITPLANLPLTLGHENAGYVEELGPDISNLKKGDPVAVLGCWGCGRCRFCRQGEEQFCISGNFVGITTDGGYAEYLLIPNTHHLIKLDGMDPVETAPLTDAGLTPYRAIKKTLPFLYPGSAAVILGVGGLGHIGIQILKAVSPGARVIAVDVTEDKLQLALKLGADFVVDGRGDAAAEIKKITSGEGARAVIDMVGSDSTLKIAAAASSRKGILCLVGLAGGTLPYSFMGLPFECVVTSSSWGTYTELEELLNLATAGKVQAHIQRFSLEDINEAFHLMEKGKLLGRAVITP